MLASLYSGGKDSTLAIHRLHEHGLRTELLITMVSENEFSYMFHKPNVQFTKLQAEAMGIRQVMARTRGEKETELADLEKAFRSNGVTELVTGAVASTYQRDRIARICERLSIKLHSPLWGIDPLVELAELSKNYDAIVTQVSAEGFDDSMLGARIDEKMITKLKALHEKYRINMLFEGGEAESFVLDAPLFRKRIAITKAHKEWDGDVGRYIIDSAELVGK